VKARASAVELPRLLLVGSLPLVFNPWGYSAFELPKAVLLRMVVILLGWLAILAHLERSTPIPRLKPRSPMSWAILVFGCLAIGATLLSPDPRTSLWGTLERQQGLLTVLSYLGLTWVTTHQLRTQRRVRRLWTVLVWGSLPVVAYGLAQALGFRLLGWETDAASPVLSTLGRANFLGSYLVLVAPLTAALAFAGPRRVPMLLLFSVQLICLLLTLARGAWLGLFAALIIALLAWSYATGRRRAAVAALILVLLAAGFVVLLLRLPGSDALLTSHPAIERLTSLTRTDEGSVAARLTIWRATLPLIAERPWLGYGFDTMCPHFLRVFPPQLVYYQGRGVLVDRAHNLWLDLGMSMGASGALAFAALLVTAFLQIGAGLRSSRDRVDRLLWVALAAALGGHLVNLQVSFSLTASNAIFWLLLAVVAARSRALEAPEVEQTSAASPLVFVPRLVYLPPTLVLLALLAQISLRPLLADVVYWKSEQNTRPFESRIQDGERAVRLWPVEPAYRLGLAELYAQAGECGGAEAQILVAQRATPEDPQRWAARAAIYARCAAPARAETAWAEAIRLAPTVAAYHRELGLAFAQAGRIKQAADALRRAVELDGTDATAYRALAKVYQGLGKEDAAEEARQQAEYWTRRTAQ
jgi:putative inorganic carbon (HCO3(-)) transporter